MPNAGYFNSEGGSFGFVAPSKGTGKKQSQFPYFDKPGVTLSSNAAKVEVVNTETFIDLSGSDLAANATLKLDIKAPVGSKLYVKSKSGATAYNVVLKDADGTNTYATLNGAQNATKFYTLLWDGESLNIV